MDSKLLKEGKPVDHEHKDIPNGSYVSTGENLLGKIVSSEMEKVVCDLCGSESVRLKVEYIEGLSNKT